MKLEVTSVRVAESGILEAISSPTADEHGEPAFEAKPAEHILPVDPGFTIDMFSCFRELKGQDMEFSHRADASLMGRPMPARQISSVPPKWKLNVDVFVFCDGHSAQRDPASWVRVASYSCVPDCIHALRVGPWQRSLYAQVAHHPETVSTILYEPSRNGLL